MSPSSTALAGADPGARAFVSTELVIKLGIVLTVGPLIQINDRGIARGIAHSSISRLANVSAADRF